jgi:hypothetical protein
VVIAQRQPQPAVACRGQAGGEQSAGRVGVSVTQIESNALVGGRFRPAPIAQGVSYAEPPPDAFGASLVDAVTVSPNKANNVSADHGGGYLTCHRTGNGSGGVD